MADHSKMLLGGAPPRLDKRTIRMSTILNPASLPPLPDSFDLDAERGITAHSMFLNDTYGCCVIAATANMTRNFENYEQRSDPAITDADVKAQYFKESGGADGGLVELDHLNTWRKDGFLVGGKIYKIHAFVAVNWKDHREVKYCIYLFNGIFLGLALPVTARNQDVWDVVDPNLQGNSKPGSWGYHAVLGQSYPKDNTPGPIPPTPTPPKPGCFPGSQLAVLLKRKVRVVGVNALGPVVLTWGIRKQVTWAWWDSYVSESYCIVDAPDEWVDPLTDPLNMTLLDQQLAEVTA